MLMDDKIKEAISILNQGGIVIYPTDTVFGIGCRIDNINTIKRLFAIRRRPETQATPVLVDSVVMSEKYVLDISSDVLKTLIARYWPGALTLVLHCDRVMVPFLVRGGGNTVGVRMPKHDTALALIKGVGVPLLGPSANFHGGKTPFRYEDLDRKLFKLVDFVVPGECQIKQASTVIDCTVKPWKILRQGAVKLKIDLTAGRQEVDS